MKRVLSIFILLIFLMGQYAVLATDEGVRDDETAVPETHYSAVTHSATGSSFEQHETEEVETVSVSSVGAGVVATITKTIPVLERQPWINITSNLTIDLVVKKEGDHVSITIKQPKWQDAVKYLWEQGERYAYLEKELVIDVDDGATTFILYRDFSVAYQETGGSVVEIGSPLDDIELTSAKIKEDIVGGFKDETWDLNRELQKVLAFYGVRQSELVERKPLAVKQYEASKTAFEETRALIDQTYQDPFVRDFLETSFIAQVIETITTDEYWTDEYAKAFPDAEHPEQQDADLQRFQAQQVKLLVQKLLGMEHFKSYKRTKKMGRNIEGRLEPLLRLTSQRENAHGDPVLCEKSKDAVEQLLNTALAAGELGRRHLPVHTTNRDMGLEGTFAVRDVTPETLGGWFGEPATQIDILKGLLLLEQMESTVKEDGSCKFVVQDDHFSTKRLLLGEALSFQYVKNDQVSDAFATVEQLGEELDALNVTDEVSKESVLKLKNRLKLTRSVVTQAGFKKILLDLSVLLAQVQKIDRSRSSWAENVIKDDGSWNLFTAILDGGYLTYYVNKAGIWDADRSMVNVAEANLNSRLKGVSMLQSLAQGGVSGADVQRWLAGDLTGNDLAAEFSINNPKITKRQLIMMLHETKDDVAMVYDRGNFLYDDLQVLLGEQTLGYGENFTASTKFSFEDETTKKQLRERIDGLRLTGAGKIFSFVDHGLNPVAITVGLVSGGLGGTLIGASVKGVQGAALAVAENVIIDAATGSVLVASGLDPNEDVWMAMGAMMGISIAAGAGLARMSKSFRPIFHDLADLSQEDLLRAGLFREPDGYITDIRGNIFRPDYEEISKMTDEQLAQLGLQRRGSSLVDENEREIVGAEKYAEHIKLVQRKAVVRDHRAPFEHFLDTVLEAEHKISSRQLQQLSPLFDDLPSSSIREVVDEYMDRILIFAEDSRPSFFDPDISGFIMGDDMRKTLEVSEEFQQVWNRVMRERAEDITRKEELLQRMLVADRQTPLRTRVGTPNNPSPNFLRASSSLDRDSLRELTLRLIESDDSFLEFLSRESVTIRIMTRNQFDKLHPNSRGAAGVHLWNAREVHLVEEGRASNVVHELGHAFHARLFELIDNSKLERIFARIDVGIAGAPSRYSVENIYELFAESFSAYNGYVPKKIDSQVITGTVGEFVGKEAGQEWLYANNPEMFYFIDNLMTKTPTPYTTMAQVVEMPKSVVGGRVNGRSAAIFNWANDNKALTILGLGTALAGTATAIAVLLASSDSKLSYNIITLEDKDGNRLITSPETLEQDVDYSENFQVIT